MLDYAVNGRKWERTGNRSYNKPAAPHGTYRALGYQRWIAIAAFTEQQRLDLVQHQFEAGEIAGVGIE